MDPPNVARAPASLALFFSAILPLKVLKLTGEDDRVDTGMFWSPIHDATPAQVWLRTVVQESVKFLRCPPRVLVVPLRPCGAVVTACLPTYGAGAARWRPFLQR